MKKNRALAGLLALALCAGFGLAGCKKQDEPNVTPPGQTDEPNVAPPQDDPVSTLTDAEAQALVDEKLPEGYTSQAAGEIQSDDIAAGGKYKVFDVADPDGNAVGSVAIDIISGERYSVNSDGKLGEYSEFVLYDAASDADCDWNGVFQNGEITLELMQADNSSFEFIFSDDTAGVARIKGNTASYNDGELTFTYDDGQVLVGGEFAELAGTYTAG